MRCCKSEILTAYGITVNICEWARIMEIPYTRIAYRKRIGLNDHDSIFKSAKIGNNQYIKTW